MGRRTILLIASLLVASLGALLVYLYASNANDRAQAGMAPQQVLVAKSQVAAGTSAAAAAQAGAFELRTVVKDSVAPGAVSDITGISDQVALAPIFPGQQVLQQQFGAPQDATTLPIPAGKMAMSVQLTDPQRVAGFVSSGSEVAVFVTTTPLGGNAQAQPVTQVLVPRVQVIGVGNTTIQRTTTTDSSGQQNTEEIPKAILTLAVDQAQATKLIYGTQQGQLYFALLTPQSKVAAGEPVTGSTLTR